MRFLLYVIGGAIALVAIVISLATLFLPTDWVVEQLKAQVRENTGRELRIDGDTSLTFYPSLGIEMSGLTLSGPPGMADEPFITAREVAVAVPVVPLLSRQLQVERFRLIDPQINLVVSTSGQRNFDFADAENDPGTAQASAAENFDNPDLAEFVRGRTTDGASSPDPSATQAASSGAETPEQAAAEALNMLSALTIEEFQIVNGTITYDDRPKGSVMEARDVNLSLALPDRNAPLSLRGNAVVNGEQVNLVAGVRSVAALLEADRTTLDASLTSDMTDISYAGTIQLAQAAALNGKLEARSDDLGRALAWASGEQATQDLGPAELSTTLDFNSARGVQLDGLAIRALDTSINGTVSADTTGERPRVSGALAVSGLNVDTLQDRLTSNQATGAADASGYDDAGQGQVGVNPLAGDARSQRAVRSGAGANSQSGNGWDDTQIDVSVLRAVDVALDLDIADLRLAGLKIDRLTAQPVIKNGQGRKIGRAHV